MMYLAGMALCALLFVLFGLARPRTECNGSGCGACGGVCRREELGGTND
jgi:hypothetical protein